MATVAVPKQSRKMLESLTTPEQIQNALAKVFQESQGSVAGHRKQVILLKNIQQRAHDLEHEDSFNYFFCRLINKVLLVKKTESVGDRIVKLVASFILNLQEQYKDAEDDDNLFNRFVHFFVTHLLRGVDSKDRNVRYRSVQFLDFAMGGLGEIDDALYDSLMWALDKRLHDKEPSVRIKALHCIARFQDLDSAEIDDATSKLLVAIQNDSSAEVRRAALLNLVKTNVTKHYLLERARDTNAINRRLVYSRIIKEFGDFRLIDSRTREKILLWGLKDREESVQKACVKMLSQDWLNTIDGDLIELLQRLHVTHSEVGEIAMKHFFNNRKDLIGKISFPPDIWLKLDPEIAFLARTFYYHCFENTLNDIIDSNYPEAAEMANLLERYLNIRKSSENLEDAEDVDFVIEQLLTIGVNYDFSDEIGRRAMLRVVRSSLANDRLTDKLIKVSLQVLRKLSINERDFCSMINEIVTDIRDNDIDQQEAEEGEEVQEDEKTTIHCLSICKSMLELTNEPLKDNISISSLIETFIKPAVRNTTSTIRELGTITLGLCCLLDLDLAIDQLYLFGLCLSKGHEELKVIAIKVMFDVLSVWGSKVLDVEGGVDSLSFHKLLYRTLKNPEVQEVQALTAEGLCKLYLADILSDDELFETLILTYYNPGNAANQSLLQAFTFCLPVYCFSHAQHQERMSRVAADAFKRLYAAHAEDTDEDEPEMVSPSIILQQIVHWTDPNNVVNQDEEKLATSLSHVTLAVDLLNTFDEIDSKKYRKMVLTSLPKLHIGTNVEFASLKELIDTCSEWEEVVATQDLPSKNAFAKFVKNIETLFQEASSKQESQVNEEDQEFSVILENQGEEEKKDEEEVDEEFEEEQMSRIIDQDEIKKESSEHSERDEYEEDEGEESLATANEHVLKSEVSDITNIDQDGDLSME